MDDSKTYSQTEVEMLLDRLCVVGVTKSECDRHEVLKSLLQKAGFDQDIDGNYYWPSPFHRMESQHRIERKQKAGVK